MNWLLGECGDSAKLTKRRNGWQRGAFAKRADEKEKPPHSEVAISLIREVLARKEPPACDTRRTQDRGAQKSEAGRLRRCGDRVGADQETRRASIGIAIGAWRCIQPGAILKIEGQGVRARPKIVRRERGDNVERFQVGTGSEGIHTNDGASREKRTDTVITGERTGEIGCRGQGERGGVDVQAIGDADRARPIRIDPSRARNCENPSRIGRGIERGNRGTTWRCDVIGRHPCAEIEIVRHGNCRRYGDGKQNKTVIEPHEIPQRKQRRCPIMMPIL